MKLAIIKYNSGNIRSVAFALERLNVNFDITDEVDKITSADKVIFPGVGEAGPDNVAVALFSFPSIEAYETYRREVANDSECLAVTSHYERTKCFTKYERTFMGAVRR